MVILSDWIWKVVSSGWRLFPGELATSHDDSMSSKLIWCFSRKTEPGQNRIIFSKKSLIGPTEGTPKLECLTALVTWGSVGKVPFHFCWIFGFLCFRPFPASIEMGSWSPFDQHTVDPSVLKEKVMALKRCDVQQMIEHLEENSCYWVRVSWGILFCYSLGITMWWVLKVDGQLFWCHCFVLCTRGMWANGRVLTG